MSNKIISKHMKRETNAVVTCIGNKLVVKLDATLWYERCLRPLLFVKQDLAAAPVESSEQSNSQKQQQQQQQQQQQKKERKKERKTERKQKLGFCHLDRSTTTTTNPPVSDQIHQLVNNADPPFSRKKSVWWAAFTSLSSPCK